MCGIAGLAPILSNRNMSIDIAHEMIVQLKHRGPDVGGIYYKRSTTSAHVRWSTIDIEMGQQFMTEEEGVFWKTLTPSTTFNTIYEVPPGALYDCTWTGPDCPAILLRNAPGKRKSHQ